MEDKETHGPDSEISHDAQPAVSETPFSHRIGCTAKRRVGCGRYMKRGFCPEGDRLDGIRRTAQTFSVTTSWCGPVFLRVPFSIKAISRASRAA